MMKEKRNFKIKKMFKSRVFFFVLGLFLASAIGVSATTLLYSRDVTYDNSSSGMSATTVQDALDELYEQAKNAPECDNEGNCTITCSSGETYVFTSTGYKCAPCFTYTNIIQEIVTSGDGLYADSTESGRYYYSGSAANTKNNIVFNGDPYRILGFEPDGRIKIMKMVSLGTRSWDSTKNIWSNSQLKSYLNSTWLTNQRGGGNYNSLSFSNTWYAGAVYTISSESAAYTEEKETTVSATVGLISVSEYLKSKQSGNTFLSYSSSWWTLSPGSGTESAWYVRSGNLTGGASNNYSVPSAQYVFPVLYLKSTVSLTGSGTSTDPYCISGSSCPTNLNFTQRAS